MKQLQSGPNIYRMAQTYGWGNTSMGESQWIANMKSKYGNGWRRKVQDKISLPLSAVQTKNVLSANDNPSQAPMFNTGKLPWDYPVDQPVSWTPKSLIKTKTQCMNQLDLIKCDPSLRFTSVDKSVYEKYGIAQDGTQTKQIPMFQFANVNGVMTERSQSEIDGMNAKLDSYCTKVVENCEQRFPNTPPEEEIVEETLKDIRLDDMPPPPSPLEEKSFIQKYKYPLIAVGIVIIAILIMKNKAQPTVIVTK